MTSELNFEMPFRNAEMNRKTTAIVLFTILCLACLTHAIYYYPLLPDQVAHHFGPSGKPDAWGSKTNFLIGYLATVAVIAAIFLGSCLIMPKIPDQMINLPNKDYWLAPDRRRQTLNYIQSALLWFGSLTMLLMLDIFHQSFQVNLGKATTLNHIWISLGIYSILSTIWCIAFIRKFYKKDS
jgi:uncharacterized membrane protein